MSTSDLSPRSQPSNILVRIRALRDRREVHRLVDLQRRVPLLQIAVLAILFLYGRASFVGFSSRNSVYSMLVLACFLGLAGAGQTLVVLIGGLDLSIPAYIAGADILTAHLTGADHWSFAASTALIVVLALGFGALSGYISHRFKVEPLIITLAMSSVLSGLLLGAVPTALNGSAPQWLTNLTAANGTTFGVSIPPAVLIWVVLIVVIGLVLHRTTAGRRVYLTGAGPRAAELTRVRTTRVWMAVFACSALLAAFSGILLAGFSGSGDTTVGDPYLFESLAAVIVGGTMMGGRGDYTRTVLGALITVVIGAIIGGLGYSTGDQQIIYGAIIMLVVAAYGRERRLRDRV